MKKYATLLLIFLGPLLMSAQNTDSIPNPGFEHWFVTPMFAFPAGWMTNNGDFVASTVNPDVDSYSGTYAMQLINAGTYAAQAWAGFPVQHHPISLDGYMKNNLQAGDSGVFTVWLFFQQQLVDSGQMIVYSSAIHTYQPFSIPVSQNAPVVDSCVINLFGGQTNMSVILLDDLSFSFPQLVPMVVRNESWSIYPNPFTRNIFMKRNSAARFPLELSIYDFAGKLVFRKTMHSGDLSSGETLSADLQFLPATTYTLELNDGVALFRTKVLKEK